MTEVIKNDKKIMTEEEKAVRKIELLKRKEEKKVEKHIDFLLSELERYCYAEKCPMIACVAIGDGKTEKDFMTRMISCAVVGKKLEDDRIASMACMFNGFRAVPAFETTEIEEFVNPEIKEIFPNEEIIEDIPEDI